MLKHVSVLVCVFSLLLAPIAQAETAPIPAGAAAPGTDPSHQTPLELLASQIATHIAGVPATVRCENAASWDAVTSLVGLDPTGTLGFVSPPDHYAATNTWAARASVIELAPTTCAVLQQFAQATNKPTECRATVNRYVTKTKHRYVKRGKKRVRIAYRARVLVQSLAPPAPCFLGVTSATGAVCARNVTPSTCYTAASRDFTYWQTYENAAEAINTLAHEPVHIAQDQAGLPIPPDSLVESQATCSAMQWMPYVAEQLGADPTDAQSVADYFWKVDYPGLKNPPDVYSQTHPAWSADCVPGGKLDVRPAGSSVWP